MQALSRAIIFARVSSKSQEDEGYSLDSQLKVLRDGGVSFAVLTCVRGGASMRPGSNAWLFRYP